MFIAKNKVQMFQLYRYFTDFQERLQTNLRLYEAKK